MIDVFKELRKYTSVDISKEAIHENEEFSVIFRNITKVYE